MKILGTFILGLVSLFYYADDSVLTKVHRVGELRVAIYDGLTTYYKRPDGQLAGIEYELAKYFARELGVKLNIIKTSNSTEAFKQVMDNKVHFAVGLAITKEYQNKIRFTPPYQNVSYQIIHHNNIIPPPNSFKYFNNKHKLYFSTKHTKVLEPLQTEYPKLLLQELSDTTPNELAKKIHDKEIKYAVLKSNLFTRVRLFYPELKASLTFPQQHHLAWAFSNSDDNSLYLTAIQFLNKLHKNGKLKQLIENYYGYTNNVKDFTYLHIRNFLRHVKKRLPMYQEQFQLMAKQYNLDWRLLAAIGYQESKWNSKAVSVTGVKGIMMLTKMTADEMGIKDRTDPFESIQGGTKYFTILKQRISKQILGPDRVWLALAAYNIGIGHMRDARKITASHGDNPNLWQDVKKHLPKLSQRNWYIKTKYGYARGYESIEYVENIRMFYDILLMNII
ncbi:MAG: membrane-bound lytic murein transglycosylase MltF [Candidatus Marithrix sp.]|nr:membrane-bound lytic murein transglycosylase MltF [Candidatus Marithrix sp.]